MHRTVATAWPALSAGGRSGVGGFFDTVPLWLVLAIVASAAAVGLAVTASAGFRLGVRRGNPEAAVTRRERMKDAVLLIAALIAGSTVYGGFVIGSYQGLTDFARGTLGWEDWRQYIVPITLDGGAAAFGFLAFRAVKRGQSPYRCYLVVWGAAGASAIFNFLRGGETHGLQAGIYLAFLSFVGMVMFHTFLDQFGAGGGFTKRRYPRFGIRWLTYPSHTVRAFLAWVNHPPEAGTEVSVRAAIHHLEEVRSEKMLRRAALEALADRVGSPDFRWAVLAVNIQREVGGNLAEILDNVSDTLRERAMMRRQIRVLTAEGRLSAWVLSILPFAIALYMFAVNPKYISLLFTKQIGLFMLGVGGVLMVLGILWMRKIVDIDV